MTLAAVIACRNQSTRLYAKPLQNLDVARGVTILEHLVGQLKLRPEIDSIVLAISANEENRIYTEVADSLGVDHVLGDDDDVLGRLVDGARRAGADRVFRVTSESPYPYLDDLADVLAAHDAASAAFTTTSGLPDGSFYEIIEASALERSWGEGGAPYRNELCSRYIFDHQDVFTIQTLDVPQQLRRANEIRLTVDWPEDLIVLRTVYEELGLSPSEPHDLGAIIDFLDQHPKLNAVNSWIDSGEGRIWY